MTDPVQPRPQPVLDQAKLAGLVGAAFVAVAGLVFWFIQGGFNASTIYQAGHLIELAVTAVLALGAYASSVWHGMQAAKHVTPIADPVVPGKVVVSAEEYGRHAAAPYNQGGYIPGGPTPVVNMGKPEHIISAEQAREAGRDFLDRLTHHPRFKRHAAKFERSDASQMSGSSFPEPRYKLGRAPNQGRPRIKLTANLVSELQPPKSVDYYSKVPANTWGMDGNDSVGDCTCAEVDHAVKTLQVAAGNTEVQSKPSEVLTAYSAITGYNPGDPSTDQGAEMQAVRDYWRKNGFVLGGQKHTIALFAQVDHTDHALVKWCIWRFGELGVGINFPDSAMTQFHQGKPWDVVKGAKIEGGHAIAAVGYDDQFVYVVTWGKVQPVTWAFWDRYTEEAWTQLSQEWTNAVSGDDPLGETLFQLGEQYKAITGQANPFAPTPTPPVPPPASSWPPKPFYDAWRAHPRSKPKAEAFIASMESWDPAQ